MNAMCHKKAYVNILGNQEIWYFMLKTSHKLLIFDKQ